MTKTNDHYVPQSLLRNFANENGKLCVFDKWTGKVFRPSTRNIASELGYNDYLHDDGTVESFEDVLTSKEQPGAIAEIVSSKSIACLQDSSMRVSFARFVAIQVLRTRMTRIWMEQIDDAMAAKLETEFLNGTSIRRTPTQIQNESIVQLALAEELLPQLLNKQWLLAEAAPGTSYLISDNPVVRQNIEIDELRGNSGFACPGIQIFLPLSPSCVLMLVCPTLIEAMRRVPLGSDFIRDFDAGGCVPSTKESMDYCNSLQVVQSSRFVIGEECNFTLAREILREFPDLKKPKFV